VAKRRPSSREWSNTPCNSQVESRKGFGEDFPGKKVKKINYNNRVAFARASLKWVQGRKRGPIRQNIVKDKACCIEKKKAVECRKSTGTA